MTDKMEAFENDPDWKDLLLTLTETFKPPGRPLSVFWHHLALYKTPSGPGRTTYEGSPNPIHFKHQSDHWRTYGAADGLGEPSWEGLQPTGHSV